MRFVYGNALLTGTGLKSVYAGIIYFAFVFYHKDRRVSRKLSYKLIDAIMKHLILIILCVFGYLGSHAQVAGYWYAKEFSKDISLYKAKAYLFRDVLGSMQEVTQFEVIPLAAASSGELTTLLYKCESEEKEGLVLGFYGDYWNETGIVYQGFAFKNFDKDAAAEFLDKIQQAIDENSKFLRKSTDNNNIVFKYDDIDVLIWASTTSYTIRLFWNGFDSSWERTAFERSKRRFEKKTR